MAQVSAGVHAVRLAQCKEVELQLEAHGKVGGGVCLAPMLNWQADQCVAADSGAWRWLGVGQRGGCGHLCRAVTNMLSALPLLALLLLLLLLLVVLQVRGEQGYTHMQMDGEPWRQPIPAVDTPRQRTPRPAGLQESNSGAGATPRPAAAAEPAAADGAAQQQQAQAQQQGEASGHQVVVRVSHAGQSHMLLNEADPQGNKRARRLAARGAQLSKPLQSAYSLRTPRPIEGAS